MRRGCVSLGEVKCDECHNTIPYPDRYLAMEEEKSAEVEDAATRSSQENESPQDQEGNRDDRRGNRNDQDSRRRPGGRSVGNRRPRGQLHPEDPYWQFGTPVESWGSSLKGNNKQGRSGGGRSQQPRQRSYLECRYCGVKLERRASHRDRVACPICNRWMVLRGGDRPKKPRR